MSMAATEIGPAQEAAQSLSMWRLWTYMSWQDIRARYRGSLLGPFWIAGGVAAASLGAGLLYSRILHTDAHHLIAFVSVGVTLWTLISLTLVEACHAFIGSAGLIRNAALPRPLHILRTLSRNLIVFAHSLGVVVLVFLFSRTPLGPHALLAIPGFLLLVANLVWMSWFLAVLSARFRDVIQITVYFLQFAIFITPIFWYPQLAGRNFPLLQFNPFYHMLEIVRAPLLSYAVTPLDWTTSILLAVCGLLAAGLSFQSLRHNIAYWV